VVFSNLLAGCSRLATVYSTLSAIDDLLKLTFSRLFVLFSRLRADLIGLPNDKNLLQTS
jgi:hypothetical protein